MRRDAARGEGEIGLLGLAIGAAPAIRGLFHPYLVGETSRGVTVARITVCVTRMCVPSSSSLSSSSSLLHPLYSSFSTCEIAYTNAHSQIRRRECAVSSTGMRVFRYVRCAHAYTLVRVCACAHACGRAGLPRQRVLAGEMPLIGISLVEMDPLAPRKRSAVCVSVWWRCIRAPTRVTTCTRNNDLHHLQIFR